jgi:hypothetical protein
LKALFYATNASQAAQLKYYIVGMYGRPINPFALHSNTFNNLLTQIYTQFLYVLSRLEKPSAAEQRPDEPEPRRKKTTLVLI